MESRQIETDFTVFYSWQSDRPQDRCRYFIRSALKAAVTRIRSDAEVEEAPRLEHDTTGASGTPAIAETIFARIEAADVFVADVSFVGMSEPRAEKPGGPVPNPNVLIEVGYAARALGWDRIILVINEEYGSSGDQIFNLRHRRNAQSFRPAGDIDPAESARLSHALEQGVRAVMAAKHRVLEEVIAQLTVQAATFIRLYGQHKTIVPHPTNRMTLGAPVGDLDTPSYNAAVRQLQELQLLASDVGFEGLTYSWTHRGRLTLRKLGIGPGADR